MADESREALKLLLAECAELPEDAIRLRLNSLSDRGLAREAASLLAFRAQAATFLETPALEPAADPWIGRELSGYLLTSLIGEGGTSRVYRAERNDGQFRKVAAVKLLKSGIFGEDIHRRFLRERQLLADLDHPNIIRLLDGGVTGDARPYIVMDLVDGVPLSRYVRDNPWANGIGLVVQAAAAVAYAHGEGVIHRDLKPGNILVNRAGQVKLLDFGIARLLDTKSNDGVDTETQARLWTPAYASPEQALGKKAVPASDLYSLGVILYELIYGRLPYSLAGLPQHEAIRTICTASAPETLHPILEQLLNKDPDKRGTAAELHQALEAALARGESFVPGPNRFRRRAAFAAAVLLIVVSGAAVMRPRSEPTFPEPAVVERGALGPSLSPDGRKIAFLREQSSDRHFLHVKDFASGETKGLGPARFVHWSPDGARIAAVVDEGSFGTLSLIDYPSGRRTRLVRLSNILTRSIFLWHILGWSRDGREILVPQTAAGESAFSIHAYDIAARTWRRLTHPPKGAMGDSVAAWSPDGSALAFVRFQTADSADIHVRQNGREQQLTFGLALIDGIAWTPDGASIVVSTRRGTQGARLWKVDYPAGGEPELAVDLDGHSITPTIAASTTGRTRVAFHRRIRDVNMWMGDVSSEASDRALTAAAAIATECCGEPSPDGTQVAFSSDRNGRHEIWTVNLQSGIESQVTSMSGPYTDSPRWSPDGKRIIFTSASGGNRDIFIVPASGGTPQRFTTEPSEEGRPSWSRDGRWIYFRSSRTGTEQIWRKASDGSQPATQLTRSGGYEGWESPDGQHFYFIRSRVASEFWRISLSDFQEEMFFRIPYANHSVVQAHWGVGTDGIYYFDGMPHTRRHAVKRVSFAKPHAEHVRSIAAKGEVTGFRVSPFSNKILWSQADRNEDNLMVVDW